MNEQRVREIVREELEKKEANAVTIAPTIYVTHDVSVEKIAKNIALEIEKTIPQTPRHV